MYSVLIGYIGNIEQEIHKSDNNTCLFEEE